MKKCSKSTIKTAERRHCRRVGVFIVNFEQVSHLALVFLLLTLAGKCRLGYLLGKNTEVHSEPSQASTNEFFEKIING